MELYINGKQLHVTPDDVALNWSNIRFSDAVADQWSTEITLPNDPYNIDLMDCYGLLDRGAIYNNKVICSVLVDDTAKDGYLQVLSIDENTIKARCFINIIPYEVLDKKVCDYYPHEDVVYRWDRNSPITTNIAGVDEGIIPYDYTTTDFYSNILAQWHGSVSVQKVLQNIQTVENITLPSVNPLLWQLAARKKVCPSNPFQVLMGRLASENVYTDHYLDFCGGQHIVNDVKSSYSYADIKWLINYQEIDIRGTRDRWLDNHMSQNKITFNRRCDAHIKIYACATKIGGILIPKKNGESLAPATASAVHVFDSLWHVDDLLLFDDYVGFDAGDELWFHYSGSQQVGGRETEFSVIIEYTNYEWDENDYDTDLEYIPVPFIIAVDVEEPLYKEKTGYYDPYGTGDGTNSVADYSLCYFGCYTNLERDMSVREYLTSLCWIHNQKLKLDKNELLFQSANQLKSITANIEEIDPSGDNLGQTDIIGYSKLENATEFSIDNEFIEKEKTLHENGFYTADILPQYSYEMTYSDESDTDNEDNWVTDINVNFEDLEAVIMTATQDGNAYTLKKAPDIIGFGLPALTNAQTIKGKTLDDISDADYLYIDGHKYMVVEGNTDLDTFVTDFTAIQCDSVFDTIPTVVINAIYITTTTADIDFTVTGIFIQSTQLTIYADSGLTYVVAEIDGTNADNQTIHVAGLTPDTTYYAVVTAEDAQGNVGTSSARMFKTVDYSFGGHTEWTQYYDTLFADVSVSCSGAVFESTGIEYCTSPDFDGEIISGGNTTAPADTFNGNVSGFEPNTLYYFRFVATSNFGTQYYQPTIHSITTMYAPPELSITLLEDFPEALLLQFLYSGDYPSDPRDFVCTIGKTDGSGSVYDIELREMVANIPFDVIVEYLEVGTEYTVSWDVPYYENEVSLIEHFYTRFHNYDFSVVISNLTDTTVTLSETATQINSDQLTVLDIGINLATSPDFEGVRDIGGNKGSGDTFFELSKNDLTENTTYYYRPWIQTAEYGYEFGETGIFTTLYSIPAVTVNEVTHSYDTITVSVSYAGDYPVPNNGVLRLYEYGTQIQVLDASTLHVGGNTYFTFANLDELTTYTITYTGNYYNERNAITATTTATTGERVNVTCVHAWAADGKCTHTLVVTSYEAITNYVITFDNPDITMVGGWTLTGTTIEGTSQGYDYNENPYTLTIDLTLGGNYTVTRYFEFSVLYQNLTAHRNSTSTDSRYPTKRSMGADINNNTTVFQYDYDFAQSVCTLTETTTGDEHQILYTTSHPYTGINYWYIGTPLFDLPVGTYRVTHTITNVVKQSATTSLPQTYTWVGAVLTNTTFSSNLLSAKPFYNSCYAAENCFLNLCDTNGNVIQTFTTPSGQQVTASGLICATEYVWKAYFSPTEDPVTRTISTAACVTTVSVTDVTGTTAIINITFR